jgi:hypothetical protein
VPHHQQPHQSQQSWEQYFGVPQKSWLVGQTHLPALQYWPPEQAFPQAPQLLLSLWRSLHPPLQQELAQAGQALPHLPQLDESFWRFWQVVPQQVLLTHWMSQPPQLLGSLTIPRQA